MAGLEGLGALMGVIEKREMASLAQRLAALHSELEDHPLIELQDFTIREPLAEAKRTELLSRVALPAPAADAYQQMDGFTFRWSLRASPDGLNADPASVRGEAIIRPLSDVVDNREYVQDVRDDPALEPYHPITIDENGYAWAFRAEAGVAAPELHAVSDTGEAEATDLTFGRFIDRLLLCRGFDRWPSTTRHPRGQRARLLHSSLTTLFGEDGRLDTLFPSLREDETRIARRIEALTRALEAHGVAGRVERGRLSDAYPVYVCLEDDFEDAELLSKAASEAFGRRHTFESVVARAIGDVAFHRESAPR